MKRQILTLIVIILCGIPGLIACLGGILVVLLGILADGPQLMLDTNIEQSTVIITGTAGLAIGLILIVISGALVVNNFRY